MTLIFKQIFMMNGRKIFLALTLVVASSAMVFGQLAKDKIKFLGNIYSSNQIQDFALYWNQVTPENAGKWGSVEGTRNVMNWTELDAAYALAKTNGFPFKMHVMIWGSQQPNWIESLSPAEQLVEIKEWFLAVKTRYPAIDIVEVVNEPLHAPPSGLGGGKGNYINALGGSGTTGWDWVINSFKMAREYFPNAELVLNDYNIINSEAVTNQYATLAKLLLKEDLIDNLGIQGHAFTVNTMTEATITSRLNILAETGLPLYVTELDIDATLVENGAADEALQLQRYKTIFTAFWKHRSVQGITLWGSRPGMWRTSFSANLFRSDGSKRPAMTWLEDYVKTSSVSKATSIEITGGSLISTKAGSLSLKATPTQSATLNVVTWTVSDPSIARVNSAGQVTAIKDGTVIVTATARDGSGVTATTEITIVNQGDIVTGLEQENKFVFRSYPNPVVNGKFTIEGTENIQHISVRDLQGRSIHDVVVANQNSVEINLLNTAPGMYAVQLFDGNKYLVKKIVVQ